MAEYTLDDFLNDWDDKGDPSAENDMKVLRSEGPVDEADWKLFKLLSANEDERQLMVVEIKEKLRVLAAPGADDTQLQSIAINFETKMWGEAQTHRDYIQSIHEKLDELILAQAATEAEEAASREVPTIRRSARIARRRA